MATNLEFIKSAEATSTTSISITDCFTSKYDVYAITINKLSNSSTSASQLTLRFIDNTDTPITTAQYDSASHQMRSNNTSIENRNTNQTQTVFFGYIDFDPETSSSVLYVFNPTNTSSYTFYTVQTSSAVSNILHSFKGIGVLTETTEVTGIQFLSDPHNMVEGKISVYGVK